jgi:hypothetical protein
MLSVASRGLVSVIRGSRILGEKTRCNIKSRMSNCRWICLACKNVTWGSRLETFEQKDKFEYCCDVPFS